MIAVTDYFPYFALGLLWSASVNPDLKIWETRTRSTKEVLKSLRLFNSGAERLKKKTPTNHHIAQPRVLRAGFHPRSGAPPTWVLEQARPVGLGFACADFL